MRSSLRAERLSALGANCAAPPPRDARRPVNACCRPSGPDLVGRPRAIKQEMSGEFFFAIPTIAASYEYSCELGCSRWSFTSRVLQAARPRA